MRCRIPRIHSAMQSKKTRSVDWQEEVMDGQAEQSIPYVCDLTELKQVRDWEKAQLSSNPNMGLCCQKTLHTHCREWPARNANAEVQMLVDASRKPHDVVIHTDGSVTRNRWGCGFTAKQGGRTLHEDSGAHSHDLQSDHGGRSSPTCNTVASFPTGHTDYTCHHSHRLSEPPGVCNWFPRLEHSHAQSLAAKTNVDVPLLASRSQWE